MQKPSEDYDEPDAEAKDSKDMNGDNKISVDDKQLMPPPQPPIRQA